MIWSIEFLEEAEKDMKKLDHSAQIQVLKGIKKVSQNLLSVREGGYGKPFRADISCPVQKIRQFSLYVVVFAGKNRYCNLRKEEQIYMDGKQEEISLWIRKRQVTF